mgnify:CR=1 FL=1|tara:strand:- start:589 stop:1617 length:1029 start_codon:yes stop_codon:yes gene_type:complete
MALSRINTNQIVDGAVATADIADGLITTAKLADNAVTTAKTTDANITTAKLADNAVTTAKVTDGNITTAKVADDAVTQAKIGADAVGTNELANDIAISTSGNISTTGDLTVDTNLLEVTASNNKIRYTQGTNKGLVMQDSGISDTIELAFGTASDGYRKGIISASEFAHYVSTNGGSSAVKLKDQTVNGISGTNNLMERYGSTYQPYYKRVMRYENVTASSSGGLFQILQTDYYMSCAFTWTVWALDTNYPTSAFFRERSVSANTHTGRSSMSVSFQFTGKDANARETGSGSEVIDLSTTSSKTVNQANGTLNLRYSTGSYTQASVITYVEGVFLNCTVGGM